MSEKPTFKENYEILKDIADKLRNQEEPDIDALVPMVDTAIKAYTICSERITQVENMVKEKLGSVKIGQA